MAKQKAPSTKANPAATNAPQGATSPLSPHQQRWNKTWSDFNRALRSPEPFNPFPWIFRLALAGLDYVYCQSRLNVLVDKYQLHKRWTSLFPLFVVGLVLSLVMLYVGSLRNMIRDRWCQTSLGDKEETNMYCMAVIFQDAVVVYLGSMVLYNYFNACLTSPGVALSLKKYRETWSCMDNRGGFYGSRGYPKLDVALEEHRVSLYGDFDTEVQTNKDQSENLESKKANVSNTARTQEKKIFPSPNASYCKKCDIVRPPRCHHCRVCDRCVLQFDHHCVWVNNCIGYNNYRSFLALLLHIVIACWYCLFVMMVPFHELVRQEQNRQAVEYAGTQDDNGGWLMKLILRYQRSQFLDNVPTNPWALFLVMRADEGLPWTTAIKIAYPLLLGVGTIMAVFLGFHIQYVVKARTTLEHKIVLETLCNSLWKESFASTRLFGAEPSIENPFDDGWRNNLYRIIGPKPWKLFLPVHVEPPPPHVPNGSGKVVGKKIK